MNEEEETGEEVEQKLSKKELKALKKLGAVGKVGRSFARDFKAFISKGNILHMAIAFVMGVAFNDIVNSLVGDIIMQIFSAFFGKQEIGQLIWYINGTPVYYGKFLMSVITFLIIAVTLFMIIRVATSAQNTVRKMKKGAPLPPVLTVPEKTDDILKDIRKLLRDQADKGKK